MKRLCTVGAAAAAMFLFSAPAGAQVSRARLAPKAQVDTIYMANFAGKGVKNGVAVLTVYSNGTSNLVYSANYKGKTLRGTVRGTAKGGYVNVGNGSVSLVPPVMKAKTGYRAVEAKPTVGSTAIAPKTTTRQRTAVRATGGVKLPSSPTKARPTLLTTTLKLKTGGSYTSFRPSFIGFTPASIGMKNPDLKISSVTVRKRKCTLVVATSGKRHVTMYAMSEPGAKPIVGRVAGRTINGGVKINSKALTLKASGIASASRQTAVVAQPGAKLEQDGIHKTAVVQGSLKIKTASGKTVALQPEFISLSGAGITYGESGPSIVKSTR